MSVISVAICIGMDRKLGVYGRVHHRHSDRSHADRLPVPGTGEDYIFHPAPAETLGRLLAKNPTDGVAQVRFAATVRSDYRGNTRAMKAHFRAVAEGLEPLEFNTLEFEQWCSPFR